MLMTMMLRHLYSPVPLNPGSLQYNTFVHVNTYNAALNCCYSVDDMMEMVLEPMALHGVAPNAATYNRVLQQHYFDGDDLAATRTQQ